MIFANQSGFVTKLNTCCFHGRLASALREGVIDREGKLLARGRVVNRVGGSIARRRIARARKKEKEDTTRSSEGGNGRVVRATEEKQMSEGKGLAHGGGGARNVQRGGEQAVITTCWQSR